MIVEILITLLIIFLVYASCNIRSNIYLKVFCKKQTEDKIVAITFDDGPDPVQTPKVLQVLKEQQIPACSSVEVSSKLSSSELSSSELSSSLSASRLVSSASVTK